MILDDLRPRLEGARQRRDGWVAKCPAHHPDKNPRLSIHVGEKGLLVKCWAHCSLQEICQALGIRPSDLFFDALDRDPQRRQAAAQQRERTRREASAKAQQCGRRIDALREAEYFVRSRQGLDISSWTNQKLDDELNVLADAYTLLSSESHAA